MRTEDTGWQGPTYYGRSQLKEAPFETWAVGGYIFLAGLAGAASLLSCIVDVAAPAAAAGTVRRGRYLSLLAPAASALLVWDLHTPKRFYNMLRIARRTSPMSIGTWILMAFSACAGTSAAAQFIADRLPGRNWPRRLARLSHVPAALAGAGLSTYTAALLAATSTPLWAAAPQALAMRFGASSVAAGAAALSLGESSRRTRARLDAITVAALAAELAATAASHNTYRRRGVDAALDGPAGRAEGIGATGFGVIAPLGLHAASLALSPRSGPLSTVAACAVLAGSLALRIAFMSAGDASARRPDISFRFSQPANLPRRPS